MIAPASGGTELGGGLTVAPRTLTLLLVEDNPDDAALYQGYLRRELGATYAVSIAATGAQALDLFRAGTPDCVVLDFHLPDATALELLAAWRNAKGAPLTPVVVLTGRADEPTAVAALEAGAMDYVIKDRLGAEALRLVVRNAVERFRLQRAREASEERLRLVVMATGTGIWDWNLADSTEYWSDEVYTMLGLEPGVLPPGFGSISDLIHPDDQSHFDIAAQAQVADGRPYRVDLRMRRADGSEGWYRGEGQTIRDAAGRAVRLLGTLSEITAQKREEQRLRLLARAGDLLDSTLDYETTLQRMTELVVPDLADCCAIAIVDADERIVLRAISAALPPEDHTRVLARARSYPLRADGPIGAAYSLRTGKSQVIPSIMEAMARAAVWDDCDGGVPHDLPFASLISVPLLVRGRTLGAIEFLRTAAPPPYLPEDLPLAEELARRSALAMDNARLHRDALEARDLVTRLQRVTAALSATMGPDEVAEVIITRGLEALRAGGGVVSLLSENGTTLTNVRVAGYPPEIAAAWQRYPADTPAPIGESLRTRGVVLVESEEAYRTRYAPETLVQARGGSGAWAAIPLLTGERLLGALGLSFPAARIFDAAEHAAMRTLGDLCAQALERARLYEAQHAAHQEATTERDRVRQILNTLPVGVVIVDATGRVTMANGASRDILGADVLEQAAVAPDEAHSTNGAQRPDGGPAPAMETPLKRALRHGEVVHGAQQVLRQAQTGREVPVLINSAPLRDAAGTIVGAVTAFQDISALRDLERAREEFLSSAAHDLKTPLTSIRGYAQLAQRRLARLDIPRVETAPVLSGISRIMEGAEVMLGLINELVDVARLQMSGGLALHRTSIDLVALVRDGVAAQQGVSAAPIELEAEVAELIATIDAARVARVLGNLLSNAIKYSPGGGTITVRVAREDSTAGPEALIAVMDHGLGIPNADLPHIFDRFARAGNVVGQIAGTGIGLASALGIVEQHGGTIAVESREGHGTTFTVRLPLTTAQE